MVASEGKNKDMQSRIFVNKMFPGSELSLQSLQERPSLDVADYLPGSQITVQLAITLQIMIFQFGEIFLGNKKILSYRRR